MTEALSQFVQQHNIAQLVIQSSNERLFDHTVNPEPVDVYAVQKGVVALLIGIAQENYLLETMDAINHHLDPEWTRIGPWDEAKLTIEILMHMTTGMDDELKPLGEIGKTWRYNNVAYQYLKKIPCLHTGKSLNDLSREWLFDKVDMPDTSWINRPQNLADGTPFTGLLSTAGDLANLGTALLADGSAFTNEPWYLNQLGEPGSEENPAWGLMWWNNNQNRFMVAGSDKVFDGPALPAAPDDLLSARGYRGNHLGWSRQRDLVVACTTNPEGDVPRGLEQKLWKAVNESFPAP